MAQETDAVVGGAETHDESANGNGAAATDPGWRRAIEPLIETRQEDAYWRDNYDRRPYADGTLGYDQYRPAYRYGWESRMRFLDRRWDEVEKQLQQGWREHRGPSRLAWTDAKLACRDAWQRIERQLADARDLERVDEAPAS